MGLATIISFLLWRHAGSAILVDVYLSAKRFFWFAGYDRQLITFGLRLAPLEKTSILRFGLFEHMPYHEQYRLLTFRLAARSGLRDRCMTSLNPGGLPFYF